MLPKKCGARPTLIGCVLLEIHPNPPLRLRHALDLRRPWRAAKAIRLLGEDETNGNWQPSATDQVEIAASVVRLIQRALTMYDEDALADPWLPELNGDPFDWLIDERTKVSRGNVEEEVYDPWSFTVAFGVMYLDASGAELDELRTDDDESAVCAVLVAPSRKHPVCLRLRCRVLPLTALPTV